MRAIYSTALQLSSAVSWFQPGLSIHCKHIRTFIRVQIFREESIFFIS